MRHLIPVLNDDLQLTSPETPGGTYALWLRGSGARVKLNAGAVAALTLIDGQRTQEIIEANARQLGLNLPSTFLEQLLVGLEKAGFLTFTEASALPHWVLPGTGHTCEGCGRSCEGHYVGPLSREEITRIEGVWPEVQAADPSLDALKPMIRINNPDYEAEGEVYLAQRQGRCIFLGEDRLCVLHARYGAAMKPTICRLFPYVRVMTEEGPRLGVNTACFRHHVHAARAVGEPSLMARLEGELAALPQEALDRDLSQFLPLTPTPATHAMKVERIQEEELVLLAYLGGAEATLRGALALALGRGAEGMAPMGLLSPEVCRKGSRLLGRFERLLRQEKSGSIGQVLEAESGLGASYRDLVVALGSLGRGPTGVIRAQEEHLLDGLRRLMWLRETTIFGSVVVAFGAMALGWVLAMLGADDEGTGEAFFERQTAWFRLITTDGLHGQLFEGEREARGWLRALIA